MKLVSWNVNGLRAVLQKGFEESFTAINADVFCLQETKCQAGQAQIDVPGYFEYYSFAQKKGYSGTAVFTKRAPQRVLHGCGFEMLDAEGRICALEFEDFWLVCVYTPNAQRELTRLDLRMEWDDAFRAFCKGLEEGVLPGGVAYEAGISSETGEAAEQGITGEAESCAPKPVVMCGDFNVAHNEIDLKNYKTNVGNAGFTYEERGKFSELIEAGFIDTFRYLYPDKEGAYSWWSYMFHAREKNAGWRIDYFLCSESLKDRIIGADIYPEIMGSDHCPVCLELSTVSYA